MNMKPSQTAGPVYFIKEDSFKEKDIAGAICLNGKIYNVRVESLLNSIAGSTTVTLVNSNNKEELICRGAYEEPSHKYKIQVMWEDDNTCKSLNIHIFVRDSQELEQMKEWNKTLSGTAE